MSRRVQRRIRRREAALRVGARNLALYRDTHSPWPCGLQGCGEIPGLMVGTAGIGYFCLRLTDPMRYPSILLPRPGV